MSPEKATSVEVSNSASSLDLNQEADEDDDNEVRLESPIDDLRCMLGNVSET